MKKPFELNRRHFIRWALAAPAAPALAATEAPAILVLGDSGYAAVFLPLSLAIKGALVLAAVFAGAAHLVSSVVPGFVTKALASTALVNVILTVFNLFPVPPLDGSRIVAKFLRGRALLRYLSIEPYGMFIVFGLLYLGVFSRVAYPALDLAVRLLDLGRYLFAV